MARTPLVFLLTALLAACGGSDSSDGGPPARKTSAKAVTRPLLILAPKWPTKRDDATRARLTTAARGNVDKSPVPVLVPPGLGTTHTVVVGKHWYQFSHRAGGVEVSVTASRAGYRTKEVHNLKGTRVLRHTTVRMTQGEGGVHADWTENGISYMVQVQCESITDTRCTEPTFAAKTVESLVFVGGHKSTTKKTTGGTK